MSKLRRAHPEEQKVRLDDERSVGMPEEHLAKLPCDKEAPRRSKQGQVAWGE